MRYSPRADDIRIFDAGSLYTRELFYYATELASGILTLISVKHRISSCRRRVPCLWAKFT